MSQNRLLAAIMFTDIEGYTSLMQRDELDAMSIRDQHRTIFESSTSKYNGTIVQYFGDGTLSFFKSSVEAVKSAIEMQLAFIDSDIPVRIGIHVGDIIYTEEDIIGDAVNVTSRIESCALPGSILISDKVHDQIRSHREIESKFLNAYDLKNVEEALPIFAIANEGLIIPNADEIKGKLKNTKKHSSKRISKKKALVIGLLTLVAIIVIFLSYQHFSKPTLDADLSIAVLPFDNLSTDEDAEIFRDGMTEDILTYLSKVKDLRVISRTSVMQYKGTKKSIPEIAKELDVTYILEGSIRKYGNQVRVTAQLIEAKSDEHLWSENYDKTLTDIFKIQSEVSKEIVQALEVNLTDEEQLSLSEVTQYNIEAYKLFLQGRQEADKRNSESLAKSIELYRQAIDIEPKYAEAFAEIANSVYLETYYSDRDPEEAARMANDYLDKAEKISDRVSRIYSVRGLIYNIEGKKEEAKKAFEKAITLSPNDLTSRYQFATYYFYNGEKVKQLEQAEIAYRLDPLSFVSANSYFTALVENYKYDEAEQLMKLVEKNNINNNEFVINRAFFRLYTAKKDYKRAIEPLKKLVAEENAFNRFLGFSYGMIGDTINAYKTIRKIKELDISDDDGKNHQLAVAFAGLREADSVFYYLDSSRNNRAGLLYREIPAFFDFIRDDSRYPELLKSHGLTDD